MTVYCIYDASGRIIQTNKVYDPPENYEASIRDLGHKFVKQDRSSLVSMDHFYIGNEEVIERPMMPIIVSKQAIKAGGADTVVLTGAPRDAAYSFDVNIPGIGVQNVQSGELPDGELEIGMDMPCLFTIRVSQWPYQDFAQEIEAVA
ncbi:MAG: hypothetical protein V4477_16745 [Pseudomonadota bacterium]